MFYSDKELAVEISQVAKYVMELNDYFVPQDFDIRNIAELEDIYKLGIALYGLNELYLDDDINLEKVSDQEYRVSGTLYICDDGGIDYDFTYNHRPTEEEVLEDICKEWDISMDTNASIVNICKTHLNKCND